ncbi:hypothetical protein T02_1273 [Trichinella nativa]|uniref:Uncharacterized protein n=1 Tax=Trichinella nativa TaxID=6335 RepID=A0A0V1LLA6_9BILA|nr:hypothetical protein T02_1273 [Trichinella nativa]
MKQEDKISIGVKIADKNKCPLIDSALSKPSNMQLENFHKHTNWQDIESNWQDIVTSYFFFNSFHSVFLICKIMLLLTLEQKSCNDK